MYSIWRRNSTAKDAKKNTPPTVTRLQLSIIFCLYVRLKGEKPINKTKQPEKRPKAKKIRPTHLSSMKTIRTTFIQAL